MAFGGGGSKGHKNEINVTPLVDVVLVLLIIFMVVTPLLEKDIQVRVPETDDSPPEQQQKDQQQLIVTLNEKGDLAINNEVQPTIEQYGDKLKRQLAAKPKGEKIVFFMPED